MTTACSVAFAPTPLRAACARSSRRRRHRAHSPSAGQRRGAASSSSAARNSSLDGRDGVIGLDGERRGPPRGRGRRSRMAPPRTTAAASRWRSLGPGSAVAAFKKRARWPRRRPLARVEAAVYQVDMPEARRRSSTARGRIDPDIHCLLGTTKCVTAGILCVADARHLRAAARASLVLPCETVVARAPRTSARRMPAHAAAFLPCVSTATSSTGARTRAGSRRRSVESVVVPRRPRGRQLYHSVKRGRAVGHARVAYRRDSRG